MLYICGSVATSNKNINIYFEIDSNDLSERLSQQAFKTVACQQIYNLDDY